MAKHLKIEPTLEQILGEISALQKELPGIGGNYLRQLKEYLQDRQFTEDKDRKKFESGYARAVKSALKRAQEQGELSGAAAKQLKSIFRRLDTYGFITVLPVVTEEVHDCYVTPDGRIVKPYLVLPNEQRIPLY